MLRKSSGNDKYLSTHEYVTYVPEPDDKFDFAEFAAYPPRPEPIAKTTRALQSAVLRYGLENVIILTARSHAKPVEDVLENFQMPPVEVMAIASTNPIDKATTLAKMVTDGGYEKLVLYEDSISNINAIQRQIQPLLGDLFFAYQIIPAKNDVRVKKVTKLSEDAR